MATALHKAHNVMSWYSGELLHMAHDIGNRLLPAFNTSTGMPFPRVCFCHCLSTMTVNVYGKHSCLLPISLVPWLESVNYFGEGTHIDIHIIAFSCY